jgi:2-polyprenyl-3-methyl-5-hydroxy-6-metoxy-1,4-benzoquinol methylase
MLNLQANRPANATHWQDEMIEPSQRAIKPASLALILQISSIIIIFLLTWVIHYVAQRYFNQNIQFSIFHLVLMHAFTSSFLAYMAKQAHWWRWIHVGFPLAIWLSMQIEIRSEVYLACFITTASLFWTTFRSQVPFFPSRPGAWQAIEPLISTTQASRVIDIGSGLGDMSMYIAKQRPYCQSEGIEIAPLPFFISKLRAFSKSSTAQFKLGNYNDLNFGNYDIVFAYLSPVAMLPLWQKAQHEMKSGSLLISLEFEINDASPTFILTPQDQSPTLYVWRMP